MSMIIDRQETISDHIARLESLKDSVCERFVHMSAGYELRWHEIEIAFESRILTDTVINSNHIELRFLEDAGNVMLERMRDIVETW